MSNSNIDWFLKLIEKDRKKRDTQKDIKEIKVLLYLFVNSCPSKNILVNTLKFIDYGIITKQDYKDYKKRIINNINISKENYIYIESPKKIDEYRDYIYQSYKGEKLPTIIFVKGENGQIDSLFVRIRNAFAHKNFFKKNDYYIIWNDGEKHNKLSCFMMLKYSHLITIFNELKNK